MLKRKFRILHALLEAYLTQLQRVNACEEIEHGYVMVLCNETIYWGQLLEMLEHMQGRLDEQEDQEKPRPLAITRKLQEITIGQAFSDHMKVMIDNQIILTVQVLDKEENSMRLIIDWILIDAWNGKCGEVVKKKFASFWFYFTPAHFEACEAWGDLHEAMQYFEVSRRKLELREPALCKLFRGRYTYGLLIGLDILIRHKDNEGIMNFMEKYIDRVDGRYEFGERAHKKIGEEVAKFYKLEVPLANTHAFVKKVNSIILCIIKLSHPQTFKDVKRRNGLDPRTLREILWPYN